MRAIWKGHISFALVTIPISLYSATRSNDVSFKYLRKKDLSPVKYKRVAEADGEEVAWEDITRGFEFEKGRFVEVTDEDLQNVNAEITRTIQIQEFVDEADIDPIYYDKPYYLEPQKGGERAYALMREALAQSGKVGIARVVLKSKEHLAAVKPVDGMITLMMMRFPHEIVDAGQLNVPEAADISDKEMSLANTLIETMVEDFEPSRYKDQYRDQLLDILQKKVEGVTPAAAGPAPAAPGKVVDLMEVLKQSLKEKKKPSQSDVREKTVATGSRGSGGSGGKKTRTRPKKKTG